MMARFVAFSDSFVYQPGTEPTAAVSLSWAVARSAGLVAFLAATGAITLGARRPARLPIGGLPARVYAVHRALGLAALLATAVHLAALWFDHFIQFTWAELLAVPWTASYRPFAVTLGWLAMVSLVLSAASGGLRRFLPGWRAVHAAAYLTFALGLFHGLLAGSDTVTPLAPFVYVAALLAVGWASCHRLFPPPLPPGRGSRKAPAKDSWPMPGTIKKQNDNVLRRLGGRVSW
jgi:sulfoxide reductase heme-binding subunit YedZ